MRASLRESSEYSQTRPMSAEEGKHTAADVFRSGPEKSQIAANRLAHARVMARELSVIIHEISKGLDLPIETNLVHVIRGAVWPRRVAVMADDFPA